MAYRLVFNINREMMRFVVVNRFVFYSDRKMDAWMQCLPKPEGFINRIKMSRNKIPSILINMFNYSEEEMKEYESAKDDGEIADIIIRDCKTKGANLILKAEEKDVTKFDDMKIIR